MHIVSGRKRKQGLNTPSAPNVESGHIEIGSTFVIVAILGVAVFMGATGTEWGDLSLLGKAIIVGIIAAAIFAAWVFNESTKWPNVNLDSTKTPEENKESKSDEKAES